MWGLCAAQYTSHDSNSITATVPTSDHKENDAPKNRMAITPSAANHTVANAPDRTMCQEHKMGLAPHRRMV